MIDFLHVFEAAPVPFIVLDADNYAILAANHAFLATVGAARDKVVGSPFDESFPVDPHDPRSLQNVRELRAALDRVRQTGKPTAIPVQRYAIPVRGAQGEFTGTFEEHFWSVADSPIHDDNGKVRYIVHRIENITDLVRARERGDTERDDHLMHEVRADRLASEVLRYAEEMRRLNEHLAIAQRVANVGSWQIRVSDEMRIWSDEMYRITGISHEREITNETLAEVVYPGDRDDFFEARRQFIRGERPAGEFEHRIVRPDNGEVRWVRERVEVNFDENNKPAWMYGTLQDITEYRHAEMHVRESEERFRLVAKATADTIWDWNLETDVTWWNEGIETVFGYSRDIGLQSERFFSCIHPDDHDRAVEHVKAAIEGGDDEWSDEYRFRRADGTYADVALRGYVVARDRNGKAKRIVGGMNDVSSAREREVRLEEQAALLDKAQDAIIVSDINGLITFWNKGAERLYGWTEEEVMGTNKRDLLEKEPDVFDVGLQQVMTRGDWEGTLEQKRKDGRTFTVESVMSLVTDNARRPSRILCINTDITERLALEEQLRQSQRLEAVGQLTGGIAHDFNNLLTVILGNAELMVDRLPGETPLKRLATMTRDAALRGADLTHGLLAFARRQPLEPKAVDVNRLVKHLKSLLKRALPESIDIQFVGGDGLWKAFVDPAQLESVVLNLALNSKDAMPEGGKLTIETCNVWFDDAYISRNPEAAAGRYILLAVSDTGTGIPAEFVDRVFDPFFTTKEQGKGTGLGLSMAYGFVRQSGGHIKIYSEPGEGTTVKVYLPRARHESESVEAPHPETGARGIGEKVLVVEDDDLVRTHAESQLEEFGYEVLSATNGPAALEILEKEADVDLLFTDVIMSGGMNGPELVELARKIRPKLKVLYTSGYTENAVIHHGRLDDGIQLLQKPYRRNDLARKVQDALSR